MGNVGIAIGGGRAFSAPVWFFLLLIGFAFIGFRHVAMKPKK